jgi:hypothetical protein
VEPDFAEPESMHATMHGFEDEQSAFTLMVRSMQYSLFATLCAQSATPPGPWLSSRAKRGICCFFPRKIKMAAAAATTLRL